jgi:adenosylcobinamide amidohydrolase
MMASIGAEARHPSGSSRLKPPWRWRFDENTLIILLPAGYRAIGWAPMGGGVRRASVILNHQIALNDHAAASEPIKHLSRVARSLGFSPARTVAMMTGAEIRRGGFATIRRHELLVSVWCSAGCTNALRATDRATAYSSPGTINVAIAVNRGLGDGALVEAVQIAVEARVLAVQNAGVVSIRSGLPATGTGTDCVVVAAPTCGRDDKSGSIAWCGKHTVLGELLARAVLKSCASALRASQDKQS